MSFEELDSKKERILVKNNAQTIFDHLEELEGLQNNEKRWFWELIQNAIDSVEDNEQVNVKVKFASDFIEFSHDGASFTEDDILHLIYHGSTKKELEGKTGRYGTGFMTTHLLSKKVEVSGKIDGDYFKFLLNREAKDPIEQQSNLDNSYSDFKFNRGKATPNNGSFETSFLYHLDSKGIRIAENGITALKHVLPIVLALNKKLKDVIVDHNGNVSTFNRSRSIVLDEKRDVINHIIQSNGFNGNSESNIIVKNCGLTSIALNVVKVDSGYQLQKLDENIPRLLFNFPLFGTENVGIPMLINSNQFHPLRERNGIFLGEVENDKSQFNKQLIEKSLAELPVLIEVINSFNVTNPYEFFNFREPEYSNWLDRRWLLEQLNQIIDKTLEIPVAYPGFNRDTPLSFINIVIPYLENDSITELEDLYIDLCPHLIPKKEELHFWREIIRNISEIKGVNTADLQFAGDINQLCSTVESFKDLSNLISVFSLREESNSLNNAYKFLNNLFSFCEREKSDVFSSYAIVPNQKGVFKEIKPGELFIDFTADEKLKELAQLFDLPVLELLVDERIKLTEKVISKKSRTDLVSDINMKRSLLRDEDLKIDTKRLALIKNLKWLIDNNEFERIFETPVIVLHKSQNGDIAFVKRFLKDDTNKLLAPPAFWRNDYPNYENIINSKYFLIDEYSEVIDSNDIELLDRNDLLYKCPLIIKTRKPSKYDLEKMVKNEDDIQKLVNQNSEVVLDEIEYRDIAYFTMSEGHILDRVRGSFTAAKSLLTFLLEDCVKTDIHFDHLKEVTGIENSKVEIMTSVWLGRLKKVKWVPVKSDLEEGNARPVGEFPSTTNIIQLLDGDLKEKIKSDASFRLFNQLGISVADIFRGGLKNEQEKLNWDIAFFKLMVSGITADLAMQMLSDPQLQEKYKEQERNREKIERNQNIGFTFEQVFKELFEQAEFKSKGLSILRKPFGSDFEIEITDNDRFTIDSDVLQDNKEVLFEIGSFLLELKAVGKKHASMTKLQAETAASTDRFVLVVLPLGDFEITIDNVKKYARFVLDIGTQLKPKVEKIRGINLLKNDALIADSNIQIQMEGEQLKYNVQESVWLSGKSFEEFIEVLRKKHV